MSIGVKKEASDCLSLFFPFLIVSYFYIPHHAYFFFYTSRTIYAFSRKCRLF
ncbi:hypothetical protein BCR41DRAFT_234146 [Lobosporangium transversale]|uniref:Uncharacterized protein n=1 Tax=Lobosporangium transversale TaxID=64571 RepID=A0A1Y2GW41_9FUNG|nr:hypothetical protein BCR41DRAFT_234146 [Lobosporangium transversale]ORZ24818.1 hypothetical protein BCR41DRAFT_234146 [Lobosporangium transversale]|eukprot:XP_021883799.1 hypothetical protein BCR41DRAFT_234146 [Lobosporangium transversale]